MPLRLPALIHSLRPPHADLWLQDSVLECIVKNEFSFVRIEHRSRKHWDELRGLGHLRHYALDPAALEKDVEEKFLCLAALCCLIDYFWEHEATVFVKGMLRIKFTGAHGVLLLDPASVRNLELLRSLRTGDPKAGPVLPAPGVRAAPLAHARRATHRSRSMASSRPGARLRRARGSSVPR